MKKLILLLMVLAVWANAKAQEFWEEIEVPYAVKDIEFGNNNRIFIGTEYGVFYSENSGTTWINILPDDVNDISISPNGKIYALSSQYIKVSSDLGNTWTEYSHPALGEIFCLSGEDTVFIVGQTFSQTGVSFSHDGGQSWNTSSIYPSDYECGITDIEATPNGVYASISTFSTPPTDTMPYGIHKSVDGGLTWENVAFANYGVCGIASSSNNDIFAGVCNEFGWKEDANGKMVDERESFYSIRAHYFTVSDYGQILYFGGVSGDTLMRSLDYGNTFESLGAKCPDEIPLFSVLKMRIDKDGYLYLGTGTLNKLFRTRISVITDIDEKPAKNDEIRVYPNPVKDKLIIELPNGEAANRIVVYNNTGALVIEQNATHELNLQNTPSGLYFVVVETESGIIFKNKIVKE